jgi:hypothetical protein
MSRIGKDIRVNVKSGTQLPAIVVDSSNGVATIRLNGNGVLMRRLSVIGGPVKRGDVVKVDFTTAVPTVVAVSQKGLTLEDVARLIKGQPPPLQGLTKITITLFSGGSVRAMYNPSVSGLSSALADANPGDVVFLPDVDLSADFAVPTGVNLVGVSSRESVIRGNVSFEPGCLLENLRIENQNGEDATAVTALVTDPSTLMPTHKIKGCELYGFCCGAETAIGLYTASLSAIVVVENSTVVGDSNFGDGYAFYNEYGPDVRIYHSMYYGSTYDFYEEDAPV